MEDPFEEKQEEGPRQRKSWSEIRAAYWKSPWYKNFYFVDWKDIIIFLLAVLLIFGHWYDIHQYKGVLDHPCDYCQQKSLCTTYGGEVWNEGNGTPTLTGYSNTIPILNQENK